MIPVNIENYADIGGEVEECILVFTSLANEDIAFSDSAVCTRKG